MKEGRYDVARAKQYTHERTKERLAKMHALPMPCGMTRQANWYFIQETLCNMNLQDGPPHPGMTPEAGQYDSPDVDDPEEDLTSQADFDSEDEYTDATGRSGRPLPAKQNHRRNRAMHRERVHVKHNFRRGGSTRGRKLVFSLFRESNRDDSISY